MNKQEELTAIQEALSDWKNRMHTWKLYYIQDKQAKVVPFVPNDDQLYLNENLHYFNVIPKARQRWFTTDIDVFITDQCIFNENISAWIIAHTLDDAYKIFKTKVKFPYDNLGWPDTPENADFYTLWQNIKKECQIVKNNESTLEFSNWSSIYVSTSFRSWTLQFLHISEFWKIAHKSPEKAQEIISGAMEAVWEWWIIFIESTAEGKNEFYFIVKEAEQLKLTWKPLNHLEPKLFFVPWWKDPNYTLEDEHLELTTETERYFEKLEDEHSDLLAEHWVTEIKLWQKKWWQMKKKRLKNKMGREYPSFLEEAFEVIVEWAYYKKEIQELLKDHRLCKFKRDPAYPTYLATDLGMADAMSCIFFQMIWKEIRIVDWFRWSNYSVKDLHTVKLSKLWYKLEKVFTPHDWAKRSQNDWVSTSNYFRDLWYKVKQLTRDNAIMDRINLARDMFSRLWVDERLECWIWPKLLPMKLLDLIAQYREKMDHTSGLWLGYPLHNHESSHDADALWYMFRSCKWLESEMMDETAWTEAVYSPDIDDCF